MGLASIDQQLAAINARLAVLNPLRSAAGLPSIPPPAAPKLNRNVQNPNVYADAKHEAKAKLRNYRVTLDKQIKALNGILLSTPAAKPTAGPALFSEPASASDFSPAAAAGPAAASNGTEKQSASQFPIGIAAAVILIILWRARS